MSYYDFEHFWSPKQVCGQKTCPKPKVKTTNHITRIFHKFLNRDFPEDKAVISLQDTEYSSSIDD